MSAEAWTIIAAAVAIVGLIAWLRTDMKDRFGRLETGQQRLEERQIGQGERLARLEGKLDRFEPPRLHDHVAAPGSG